MGLLSKLKKVAKVFVPHLAAQDKINQETKSAVKKAGQVFNPKIPNMAGAENIRVISSAEDLEIEKEEKKKKLRRSPTLLNVDDTIGISQKRVFGV